MLFRIELQQLVGYNIQDTVLLKVASLAQRIYALQNTSSEAVIGQDLGADEHGDNRGEFGSNLSFHAPSRFIVDVPLENGASLTSDFQFKTASFDANRNGHMAYIDHNLTADLKTINLRWLKDACDLIVKNGASQLSGDELAMALCRVLLSDKAGDEVFGCPYYISHLT